jgi:hypothetical protein
MIWKVVPQPVPQLGPRRYPDLVTDDDSPLGTYAEELAALDKAAARVHRAKEQWDAAKKAARPQTVRALKAGLVEDVLGVRSEVTAHAPFSAPTVRDLADRNGIPPDNRYTRAPRRDGAAETSA